MLDVCHPGRSPVGGGRIIWRGEDTPGDERICSIGGSVVEFSPATRETRVRFPANAGWTFELICIPSEENGQEARRPGAPVQRFRSVVVITFASHAKGPQFETGRKHALAANVVETDSLSVACPVATQVSWCGRGLL